MMIRRTGKPVIGTCKHDENKGQNEYFYLYKYQ